MKLHFYSETDSLYIELKSGKAADTREISEGLNAYFDEKGVLLGLDIDNASETLDLSTLEMSSLPLAQLVAA